MSPLLFLIFIWIWIVKTYRCSYKLCHPTTVLLCVELNINELFVISFIFDYLLHPMKHFRTKDECHHHHHLSLNREGRWGTTNDFTTSFLHFSLFSTALWDLANSRPFHFLMLSSHLFLSLPCLLPLSLWPPRWFWPDLVNGRHIHTTAGYVSLQWMKKAKENWMWEQCSEIKENLRKNNSKKDLTTVKQGKATTVQDHSGKCLTEERKILNWQTEYCTELYNHVPRQTQRMTTPCFAKKWRLQYNHWRKGSWLESKTSQQNWSKQVEKM